MNKRNNKLSILMLCLLILSCHGKSKDDDEGQEQDAVTPVTVTQYTIGDMQEVVELNATSVFLQKNQLKAITNGYIKSVSVTQGQRITHGQVLFVLKSKEAENLGSTINEIDSTARFSGEIKIIANCNGFVNTINYRTGDYVMEGDVLAEIDDATGLVFLLQLPFELSPYLSKNKTLDLELPDGKIITGVVSTSMPMVDPISQTQSIAIRIKNNITIPENLIAKVMIIKNVKKNVISLPKAAVLTDETQEHFWIMKMIDKGQAVKVPIVKGIESNGQVEIVSPQLSPTDVILKTGNYGLPDTAKVVIFNDEK
ncbi:MAG: efflux RND transporter periplasmic adaptor subunit [Paludibacter sp.]|nr:efflux RND transporter periplasmic adaptor subunit [Paludibacter sp.]